jgi:hypothetical protein
MAAAFVKVIMMIMFCWWAIKQHITLSTTR